MKDCVSGCWFEPTIKNKRDILIEKLRNRIISPKRNYSTLHTGKIGGIMVGTRTLEVKLTHLVNILDVGGAIS